jgi:hypothetical protein
MPDTDEPLAIEELHEKLFQAAARTYNALYQHLPVFDKDGKPTAVEVHRCVVCKRVQVGAGVMHKGDCPVRYLGQMVARVRKEKYTTRTAGVAASEPVQVEAVKSADSGI